MATTSNLPGIFDSLKAMNNVSTLDCEGLKRLDPSESFSTRGEVPLRDRNDRMNDLNEIAAANRMARSKQRTAATTNETTSAEPITKVICQISIKQNHPHVIGFIRSFLLRKLKQTETAPNHIDDNGSLPQGCVLDVFIQHQLKLRGGVVDSSRPLSKLQLINPITLVDEFDIWLFDHLHGLFELHLIPENGSFPARWQLAANAQLSYRIQRIGDQPNEESSSHNVDRPNTSSLEKFVQDVCEKENNGMATKWIKALHDADISMFDHLASLKFTEWNELKALSLNGQKILKLYVNREKQMTASTKSEPTNQSDSSLSNCELDANLHKIRLYFHYILSEQYSLATVLTPAKLAIKCVDAAFEEMRQDGFSDDGLFDEMKMFFLPLTMTEANLAIDDERWQSLLQASWSKKYQLSTDTRSLYVKLTIVEDEYYSAEETIDKLQKEINEKEPNRRSASADVRSTAAYPDSPTDTYSPFTVEELLKIQQDKKDDLERHRADLRTRIQMNKNMLYNIDSSLQKQLDEDTKKTNRDLIKPNRGFIMYGPPGESRDLFFLLVNKWR